MSHLLVLSCDLLLLNFFITDPPSKGKLRLCCGVYIFGVRTHTTRLRESKQWRQLEEYGQVQASRVCLSGSTLEATSLLRRTPRRSTHRGTSVLDSLRYGLKTLGSGKVSLLSDILTDTAEGAEKKTQTLTPFITSGDKQKKKTPNASLQTTGAKMVG